MVGISDVGIPTVVAVFWKSDMEEFDDNQGWVLHYVWNAPCPKL